MTSATRWSFLMQALLLLVGLFFCIVKAFSPLQPTTTFGRVSVDATTRRSSATIRGSRDDNTDNPLGGLELTSKLARIDQEWQIQQRRAPGQSRWTKLVLPKEDGNDDEPTKTENIMENPLSVESSSDETVYLLEPSNSFSSSPSCLIVFVGGAGLGQFPQIAYNEFLKRLSDKLNAAVLAVPYTVGLDHFELAKQTGDRLRRAVLYCQDDPKRQYPENLPTFSLSHSLGSKLQTIYVAATDQRFRGMGFISFNNFGFGDTLQMARTFAEQLRGDYFKNGNADDTNGAREKSEDAINMIFGMAETILGAVGLDFSPNAKETERLIQLRFNDKLQQKTRLFVLDQDDLDSSQQFVRSCKGRGPSTSGVTGTHLAPVYFKFGIDELPEEIPRDMAREYAGGYESASFGDEGNMDELVQEVSSWILGNEPSRPARWEADSLDTPKLTGFIEKE